MDAVWVGLGIVILLLGLLDVFLTALNYDETGFLAGPITSMQWRLLRQVTRRISRRWRPFALRQVTGLQVLTTVFVWLAFIITGFGLVYFGAMRQSDFSYGGRDLGAGMFSAMYLSAAQLATVGTGQLSPETDVLRAVTIIETLIGLVLVTMILTFVLGVYRVVRDLRTLCARFVTLKLGEGDPTASLEPYFPAGQTTGLDSHLQAIYDSFDAYTDGLRLHHAAYYFQSGRDEFALPYALRMLAGTIATLRWGLPAGHPATVEPSLIALTAHFERFADDLHAQLRWTSTDVPELLSFEDFQAATESAGGTPSDPWVRRFTRLNQRMLRLVEGDSADHDPSEAYGRYRQWLPFTYRADRLTAAVSRDLDYQPVIRTGRGAAPGWDPAADSGSPAPIHWLQNLLNRWVALPDPGLIRLTTAVRVLLAVVLALATTVLVFTATGIPAVPPGMFAATVAMQITVMARDRTVIGRKVTTGLAILPAIGGAGLGSVISGNWTWTLIALALVALAGVWVGRFGPRAAALGQLVFMMTYFGLILHIPIAQLPDFAVAAVLGASWAYLLNFVLLPDRPGRIVRRGVAALGGCLVLALDPLIDAVSAGRWDPDISNRSRARMRQVHRCAALVEGQLATADPGDGDRSGALRHHLFDTELAASATAEAAQRLAAAGPTVPAAVRATLAGQLEWVQEQLRRVRASEQPAAPPPGLDLVPGAEPRSTTGWPRVARHLRHSAIELLDATGALFHAQTLDLADSRQATAVIAGQDSPTPHPDASPQAAATVTRWFEEVPTRRAIQAGAATLGALLAGAAISSSEQYWAALAAFLIFSGTTTTAGTGIKGAQRVIGTIGGAIIGFLIAITTGANPWLILPLVLVCVFAAMYYSAISYAVMSFWITMMISMLYEYLGKLTDVILEVRVLETVVGAAIALAAASILLPLRTRQKINQETTALLHTVGDVLDLTLTRLGGIDGDRHGLARRADTLSHQVRQVATTAAPLRQVSGTFGRDGIERLLTALNALTYYTRQAANSALTTEPATGTPDNTQRYTDLAVLTDDNVTALIQVIDGRQPRATHDLDEFEIPHPTAEPDGSPHAAETALTYLARANQAMLTLIDDGAPAPDKPPTRPDDSPA